MSDKPIAIVTGAGGGIGQVIAQTLASHDWFVVLNDIEEGNCHHTEENIRNNGGSSYCEIADISQEDSVQSLFTNVLSATGHHARLLINNAGIQTWSPLLDLSADDWNKTLSTNLTGSFLMTKYFARSLVDSTTVSDSNIRPAIINIGSGCNTQAFPNLVDYNASKGGIEMLTKSSALELGPHGIRVNCIAPGAISTQRTAAETGDYEQSWSKLTPLRRVGTPDDVANAVMLLCDPRADFISGQTINVDGGLFSQAVWPATYF